LANSPPVDGASVTVPSYEACLARQLKRGDLCWLFAPTMCGGRKQDNWRAKLKRRRQCKVLRAVFE
jgi:hypothetical protein